MCGGCALLLDGGGDGALRVHDAADDLFDPAQGGGMIDVQAADSPGVFASPSGVSFGLMEPGASGLQSVELTDAEMAGITALESAGRVGSHPDQVV